MSLGQKSKFLMLGPCSSSGSSSLFWIRTQHNQYNGSYVCFSRHVVIVMPGSQAQGTLYSSYTVIIIIIIIIIIIVPSCTFGLKEEKEKYLTSLAALLLVFCYRATLMHLAQLDNSYVTHCVNRLVLSAVQLVAVVEDVVVCRVEAGLDTVPHHLAGSGRRL